MPRRSLTVLENQALGAYRLLRVADPDGRAPIAGQFAMLAAGHEWGSQWGEEAGAGRGRPYLARAFSVARFADGEAVYLLEDVGPGTRRLCALRAGEPVWCLGPLGQGFSAPADGRRAVLVGGGVGIAPLAVWQDQLQERGHEPLVLLGFRDEQHLPGAALLREPRIASDDGSAGHHGLVTDLLLSLLREDPAVAVYACGPPGMLEAVREICARHELPLQLALEAGMACGFGACYGCVVPARDGSYLRVCVDGPVIEGERLERVIG